MNGQLAFLAEPERSEILEFPLPTPGPADLLVEVIRANVCGSDVGIWKGRHARLTHPVLGHEFVGRIVAQGGDARQDSYGTPLRTGDRVVASYFPMCLQCPTCRSGQHGSCERAYAYRTLAPADPPHFHGAFATHYYLHSDQHVLRVPDEIPDAAAAFLNCGFTTVVTGIGGLADGQGRVAIVLGGGGLGVAAYDVLTQRGYRAEIVETDPARVAALSALRLPVQAVEPADIGAFGRSTTGDVVVDVTGDPTALATALDVVALGGTIIEIGCVDTGPGLDVPIAPSSVVRRNATIRGVLRYSPEGLPTAAAFMKRSTIDYGALTDKSYSLAEVDLAMERTATREVLRPAVVPEGVR